MLSSKVMADIGAKYPYRVAIQDVRRGVSVHKSSLKSKRAEISV